MARPACLALALLAGLLCRSAAAQQGQPTSPQPLAAQAWRSPEVGSHSQAELPAEAPSQPDALTASWGGSAAPRQPSAGGALHLRHLRLRPHLGMLRRGCGTIRRQRRRSSFRACCLWMITLTQCASVLFTSVVPHIHHPQQTYATMTAPTATHSV